MEESAPQSLAEECNSSQVCMERKVEKRDSKANKNGVLSERSIREGSLYDKDRACYVLLRGWHEMSS